MKKWLRRIYNVYLNLEYYLKHFRYFKTVILRKLGKADYIQSKLYRSIALLSTLGKGLKKIIVTRISYLMKIYQLLFKEYIGGRKLFSIENAIYIVLKGIYKI